jgi:hypothetical protein
MRAAGFADLCPTTRRRLLARGLRCVGQGTLMVDLALYLRALDWSGILILYGRVFCNSDALVQTVESARGELQLKKGAGTQ